MIMLNKIKCTYIKIIELNEIKIIIIITIIIIIMKIIIIIIIIK